MSFKLDELDNSDNLENGHPSNTLFTYYIPGSEDIRILNPKHPDIRPSNMVRLFP